jgi:hypothetical protein
MRVSRRNARAESEMTVEPKKENMDGHSFEKWRFKVDEAIRAIGARAYLDDGASMVAMFNTNHDPKCAAQVWLRKLLETAP